MFKGKSLIWILGGIILAIVSTLKFNGNLWPYISAVSIIISCYHFYNEKLQVNIAVILYCLILIALGVFDNPGILAAIGLQGGWLLYSTFCLKNKTLSNLFIPLLLQVFLAVEYIISNSAYLIELDVALSIYIALSIINYFACSNRTPIPIACAVIYCLGATFLSVQVLLSIIIIYELLAGRDQSSNRTAISLSLWTSLQTLSPIMTLFLLLAPGSKLISEGKLKQLVIPLALSGGLLLDTDIVVKVLLLAALLLSLRKFRHEMRDIIKC